MRVVKSQRVRVNLWAWGRTVWKVNQGNRRVGRCQIVLKARLLYTETLEELKMLQKCSGQLCVGGIMVFLLYRSLMCRTADMRSVLEDVRELLREEREERRQRSVDEKLEKLQQTNNELSSTIAVMVSMFVYTNTQLC